MPLWGILKRMWYLGRGQQGLQPHPRLPQPPSQLCPRPTPFYPPVVGGAILTQIGLDSRTPSVVLILGEFCQFLVGNPSPLNSRQNFWGLVTWAWCGLGM